MSFLKSVSLNYKKFPDKSFYPFNLLNLNTDLKLSFSNPITIFVGENGTGKSTLLEAIALASNIHIWKKDDGTRLESNPYENQLFKFLSITWNDQPVFGSYFGSEIFNDFRYMLDNWAYSDPGQLKYFGGKSLVTQSHGQSILSYFKARYEIKGLYFLDEPETALSPKSQLELIKILNDNVNKGHAQFILATHSPILLSYLKARIYYFTNDLIYETDYIETEHYKIYKNIFSGE